MQALPYISFVPSATIGWLLQVCLDTAFQCVFSVSLDAEHSRRGGGGGGCGGGGGESLIKDLKRSANSLSRDTRPALLGWRMWRSGLPYFKMILSGLALCCTFAAMRVQGTPTGCIPTSVFSDPFFPCPWPGIRSAGIDGVGCDGWETRQG
jgi:hypothetical protein